MSVNSNEKTRLKIVLISDILDRTCNYLLAATSITSFTCVKESMTVKIFRETPTLYCDMVWKGLMLLVVQKGLKNIRKSVVPTIYEFS